VQETFEVHCGSRRCVAIGSGLGNPTVADATAQPRCRGRVRVAGAGSRQSRPAVHDHRQAAGTPVGLRPFRAVAGRCTGSAGHGARDHTAPGVGDKELSQIEFDDRTTPAGRFIAEAGMNARGEDVVWIDYDSGVSMHRVITTNAREGAPSVSQRPRLTTIVFHSAASTCPRSSTRRPCRQR